tara:strand:- start:1383 stop:3416 length:2034 start_codon:yes stop_codon:yes gene_type:complete
MAEKRKYTKKSEYWNKFKQEQSLEEVLDNPLVQYATYSPKLEGESYYNSVAKAASYDRGRNMGSTATRSNRIHKVPKRDRHSNIREGLLPYDYSADGVNVRDAIQLCQKAYANISIFRNAIDVMAELSNSDIYLEGGSKKSRDFINAWLKKVKIWNLKDQYFREYYRSGNIFLYKVDGKFSTQDFTKMIRTYGSRITNKIPLRYILLNPFDVTAKSSSSFGEAGLYEKLLSEYELERLQTPKNDTDKEILKGLPQYIRDKIKKGSYYASGVKVELDSQRLRYSFYKKQDYEPFAVPFGYSVLDDINIKMEFKKIDQAIVRTIENVILLITMGNEPSKGGINHNNLSAMQELFRNESVGRVLVSDYTTQAEFIIPEVNRVIGSEKYKVINEDIKEGLQNIVIGSEKYSNTQVKAKIFLDKLKEARHAFLNDFLASEIRDVCKSMGFRSYPTARFKEVDMRDELQLYRITTRLIELGVVTPEQGMEIINTGAFPSAETLDGGQEKFIEDRKKGYYNPLVGGVPMVEVSEEGEESESPQSITNPQTKNPIGRPPGTSGVPQQQKRRSTTTFSREEIKDIIYEIENLRVKIAKGVRAKFKVKRLNKKQNDVVDQLCEAVIASTNRELWASQADSCVKDVARIDQLKPMNKVLDISAKHELTLYPSAILYHSKSSQSKKKRV